MSAVKEIKALKEEFEKQVKLCEEIDVIKQHTHERYDYTDWNRETQSTSLNKKGKKLLEKKYLIVEHSTTGEWLDKFLEEGFDSTVPPPDHRLGRLTVKDGQWIQTRIHTSGLYVEPIKCCESVVFLAVKPEELKISSEAAQRNVEHGLTGLIDMLDAVIIENFPAERVLGRTKWLDVRWEKKETIKKHCGGERGCWIFKPNPKALANPEMKAVLDCVKYEDGILERR